MIVGTNAAATPAPVDAGSKACTSHGPFPASLSDANCGLEGQTKIVLRPWDRFWKSALATISLLSWTEPVLDFGLYNKMQRFVWLFLPAVKCTCLRSTGVPAGKRSPCLDAEGIGLTDFQMFETHTHGKQVMV